MIETKVAGCFKVIKEDKSIQRELAKRTLEFISFGNYLEEYELANVLINNGIIKFIFIQTKHMPYQDLEISITSDDVMRVYFNFHRHEELKVRDLFLFFVFHDKILIRKIRLYHLINSENV